MSDPNDRRLRQLAQALVADAPHPPSVGDDVAPPYLDLREPVPTRSRRSVLVGAAAAVALVLAGGLALAQGGYPLGTSDTQVASAPLVPTTISPAGAGPTVLESGYQLSRGSIDDPVQNTISPLGADGVPAGLIGADQAIATAPKSLVCTLGTPPCDEPYSAARLARYQGFGGFDSAADVEGPGAGDVRHDAIVWVVVRDEGDFDLALDNPTGLVITAMLVDATTGELVSAGMLLPPA